MKKNQQLPDIKWNKIIAAYEYMKQAEVENFLGDGFNITMPTTGKNKGRVTIHIL